MDVCCWSFFNCMENFYVRDILCYLTFCQIYLIEDFTRFLALCKLQNKFQLDRSNEAFSTFMFRFSFEFSWTILKIHAKCQRKVLKSGSNLSSWKSWQANRKLLTEKLFAIKSEDCGFCVRGRRCFYNENLYFSSNSRQTGQHVKKNMQRLSSNKSRLRDYPVLSTHQQATRAFWQHRIVLKNNDPNILDTILYAVDNQLCTLFLFPTTVELTTYSNTNNRFTSARGRFFLCNHTVTLFNLSHFLSCAFVNWNSCVQNKMR